MGALPFEVPEHIEPLVTVIILAHFVIIGGLVCWGLRQDTSPQAIAQQWKKES
jgi:hypothetical protein